MKLNPNSNTKTFESREVISIGLVVKDDSVLMIRRNDPEESKKHKTWQFPAGRADDCENIGDCIKREVKEETGIKVKHKKC